MDRLVVTLVVGLALSGCSASDVAPDDRSEAGTGGEVLRAHRSAPGSGMSAIVSGIVEVDPDSGCLWLSQPDGSRYPAVWPIGTVADSDPFRIILADGQVVRPGDGVEGGGGYVDADSATRGLGLEPFPPGCVQVGEAAVFNADSQLTVTPNVGLELSETLADRFTPPVSIGLELIAVNANDRSVAVIDFVTGTVHRYEPDQYVAPTDAIDGASGGGGYIHLWANGTVYSYPGRLGTQPLVYEPNPLVQVPGFAPTLEVVPAPNGEHAWLIQPGIGDGPTQVELVSLVEVQVTRLGSFQIDGSWQPAGATTEGVVLVTDDPELRTALIGADGTIINELAGTALSVGWNGAAILQPNGSLTVTDASFASSIAVEEPGPGAWAGIGGPIIPATAPPVLTGATRFLVALAEQRGNESTSSGHVIVVDSTGAAEPLYRLREGAHLASWSRGEDWIVVVEDSSVTLIPLDARQPTPLGKLIPAMHWVLSAG